MANRTKNTKLTPKVFKENLAELDTIFRYNITDDEVKLYWKYINDSEMTNELFNYVCKKIIDNEHRFPTIATFKKYIKEAPDGLGVHPAGFWKDVRDCRDNIMVPKHNLGMPPRGCSGEMLEEALKLVEKEFDGAPAKKKQYTAIVRSMGYEPLWK